MGHLAGVAPEPHRLTADDRLRRKRLHEVRLDVEVGDGGAPTTLPRCSTVKVRPYGLVAPRVVDEADVVLERDGDVALRELQRRHRAVAVEAAVGVLPLPDERLRRRAEVDAEETVDRREDLLLGLTQVLLDAPSAAWARRSRAAWRRIVLRIAVHQARCCSSSSSPASRPSARDRA